MAVVCPTKNMTEFEKVKIPNEFKSSGRCVRCSRKLLKKGQRYMIRIACACNTCVFDYAICMDCLEREDREMSYVSRGMRDHWIRKHIRLEERLEKFSRIAPRDPIPWITRCAVTGLHFMEAGEFQILVLCENDRVILNGYPLMVSWEALKGLRELLSEETLADWDKFAEDYLEHPKRLERIQRALLENDSQ